MRLIPKDVDTRNLQKDLVSKRFGKKSVRFAKVRLKVRRKFGERVQWEVDRMTSQRFHQKPSDFYDCGRHGEGYLYKDGSMKFRPFFCNLRRLCILCFDRYKGMMRWKYENRLLQCAMAMKVPALIFATYTLHPEIRQAIPTGMNKEGVKILNEIQSMTVDCLKQAVGVGKHRGREITGIVSVVHPFGSRNPFQPFLHFHNILVPIKITKDGKVIDLPLRVDADKARKLWHDAQVRLAKKLGISLANKNTVVHFKWSLLSTEAKTRHRIKYVFRSLIDTIFLSVKYFTEDLEGFLWFEDVGTDWLPHLDKWEVLERALQAYMNYPVKMIKSYGFLRNLKKYAPVLGLWNVEEAKDEEPVETFPCLIRRIHKAFYSYSLKRSIFKLSIEVKYKDKDWHPVPIESVIGENCSGKTKFRWIRGP